MPLNDAACRQAPAKATRIRVTVLVTRAAILSRFLLVAKARFRRCEKLTAMQLEAVFDDAIRTHALQVFPEYRDCISAKAGDHTVRKLAQCWDKMVKDKTPLGQFWSFSSYGALAYWGNNEQPVVRLEAVVARNNVDWITTIRRNMNHTLSDDEQQVLLPSGTPIRLLRMRIGRGSLPMTSKSRTT